MTDDAGGRRRSLTTALGAVAFALSAPARGQQPSPATTPQPKAGKLQIAMLVYHEMILLDLVAPLTVFSILGAQIHLVARDRSPVRTDAGIPVEPSAAFADCPADVDVLFVPGGLAGSIVAMGDADTLGFIAARGAVARYATSVCTGSLVLGAAGVLRGYRATSHWYVRDLLGRMGAIVATDRVVVDRNRVMAGGVTAGIDFALALATLLASEDDARRIQLVPEYDPQPPLNAGTPAAAGSEVVSSVLHRRAPVLAAAASAADQARARLGL